MGVCDFWLWWSPIWELFTLSPLPPFPVGWGDDTVVGALSDVVWFRLLWSGLLYMP